ncbi:hypothetical protein ACIRBX_25420 [Kitasatospora sp. NPDC096147]|uniref:hypothetical protein n=1 Tax=Kitasatospora sp. NPDC096147 TaxID=3364093 RepID=UPI0038287DEA
MAWFAVGDSTDDHRKTLAAGNAAMGLWVRCGAYASAHLTDGVIPGPVAAKLGTPTQIRKLLAAELWHEARHACRACPQVKQGDFVMHGYLEANPSRRQVLERRERAAEKKRQQRGGAANGDQLPERAAADGNDSGQSGASRRDERVPRARPAPALPSRREGAGVGVRAAGGGGARRHPFPESFAPDEAALLWADHEGHTHRLGGRPGLQATTEAFADWHQGQGTLASSWQALWRKWVREQRACPTPAAVPAAREPSPGASKSTAAAAGVSVAERFAGIEARIADDEPAARPLALVGPSAAHAPGRERQAVMPGQRPLMAAVPGGWVDPGDVPDVGAVVEAIALHGQAAAVGMFGWRSVSAVLAVPLPESVGR